MQESGYHEGGEDWKYKMWARAGVAQWLEYWLEYWGITGSSPPWSKAGEDEQQRNIKCGVIGT